MTTLYLNMLLFGLAGIILHALLKIKDINDDLKTTNYKQVFVKYWQVDWPIFLISVIAVVVFVYTSDEWLPINATNVIEKSSSEVKDKTVIGIVLSSLSKAIKILTFTFGLIADWALGLWISVTKKYLRSQALASGATMDDIIPKPKN